MSCYWPESVNDDKPMIDSEVILWARSIIEELMGYLENELGGSPCADELYTEADSWLQETAEREKK